MEDTNYINELNLNIITKKERQRELRKVESFSRNLNFNDLNVMLNLTKKAQ